MKYTNDEFREILKSPPLCKCGCKNTISIRKFHKYDGIPLYINHHYFKTEEYKKLSQEKHKDPKSAYNSIEYRDKIRQGGKNRVNTDEYRNKCRLAKLGEKNPNFGKIPHHLSDIHKIWKERNPEAYFKHQSDAGKKAFYACPRISSQELIIQEFLKKLGIKFIPQFEYQEGIADFLIPPNLVLFVDGDFWHGNLQRFPVNTLSETQKKTKEKDARQRKYLMDHGYTVKQLWEHDIKTMTIDQFSLFLSNCEIKKHEEH